MPDGARAGDASAGHASAGSAADGLLDRLAAAVAARVRGRRMAEERLGSFAFHEEPTDSRRKAGPSGASLQAGPPVPDPAPVDWRYFVVRALGALDDRDALAILEALPPDGRPFGELVDLGQAAVPDRVAAADRVGRLAAAGLVGRDLESDRVSLLPLGEILLELVADVSRRAAAADR